jgi:hypothetical protein
MHAACIVLNCSCSQDAGDVRETSATIHEVMHRSCGGVIIYLQHECDKVPESDFYSEHWNMYYNAVPGIFAACMFCISIW